MLSIIVAKANNNVIGTNNELPWKIKEDMTFFRNKTLNGTVVMGRRTFESIGKPLKRRRNLVLSRGIDIEHQDVTIVNLNEVIQLAQSDEEVFVIGGAEVYSLLLPWCTRAYITDIFLDVEDADAFFPQLDSSEWKLNPSEREFTENGINMIFRTYERI